MSYRGKGRFDPGDPESDSEDDSDDDNSISNFNSNSMSHHSLGTSNPSSAGDLAVYIVDGSIFCF